MLTFMTGRETATPTPPSFLKMAPRKSGIEIKGKPKKKWRMTARENTLSIKSQMEFWVLVLRVHFQFSSESGIREKEALDPEQWFLMWGACPHGGQFDF